MFRYRYFSNVMDNSDPSKCDALFLWQPQTVCHGNGIIGQPVAVAFRVWVLRLNTQGQAEQDRLRILQFVGECLQTQEGACTGQEFLTVNGLAQEIVRAAGNSLNSLV